MEQSTSAKSSFGSPDSPFALRAVETLLDRQYGERTIKIVPTQAEEEIQNWRVQIRKAERSPEESGESKKSKKSNYFCPNDLRQFEFPYQFDFRLVTRVR